MDRSRPERRLPDQGQPERRPPDRGRLERRPPDQDRTRRAGRLRRSWVGHYLAAGNNVYGCRLSHGQAPPATGRTPGQGATAMAKTWLITGASRGLGRELARQVLADGDRLIATAR